MTDSATCGSIEVGEAMASSEALAELRALMDRVISPVSAPLEKMPLEAHHDRQQEGARANEP
jgi:hypothetical protein